MSKRKRFKPERIGRVMKVDMLELLKDLLGEEPWKKRYFLCPFHDEKTPSLRIERGGWGQNAAHCYGCGAHYEKPIYFVMEYNRCSFAEAVLFLERWMKKRGEY